MSMLSSTASTRASVGAKSFASSRKKRFTSHPAVSKAEAYSAKVGAVTSALWGFAAQTSRKMRSAAPLPQRICSCGTPSARLSAARRVRQRGSG